MDINSCPNSDLTIGCGQKKQEKRKGFRLNIHEEDPGRKKLEETGERKKEKFSQT